MPACTTPSICRPAVGSVTDDAVAQGGPGYHDLKTNPDIEMHAGQKRFAVTPQPVLPGDLDRRIPEEDPATIPDRHVDTKALIGRDCQEG